LNLRKLAAGKDCVVRLPGVCNGNPETTVLAHLKRGWCGSVKPPDICGVYACSACHDAIDGRRRFDEYTREQIDAILLRALCQQLAGYAKEGVVKW
jgi:hypothetical protein